MHPISQRYVPPPAYQLIRDDHQSPPGYQPSYGDSPPPSYTAEYSHPFPYGSERLTGAYPNEPPPPYPGSRGDEYIPAARLPSYPHDKQVLRCPDSVSGLAFEGYLAPDNRNRERPIRTTHIADRRCHVVFFKVIAMPFVFLGGTVFGAVYGLFRGVATGISETIEIINDSPCDVCTKVLLIPCLFYFALANVYRNVIHGFLVGAIFGGYVLCKSLWNGDDSIPENIIVFQCLDRHIIDFFMGRYMFAEDWKFKFEAASLG